MSRWRLRRAAFAVGVAASLLAPADAPAVSVGFNEPLLGYVPAGDQQLLISRMSDAGARRVRIAIQWNEVAQAAAPPDDATASDPGWSGYSWGGLDSAVTQSVISGVEPLLVVERAPTWAEGPNRPAAALPGTWRPSPGRLAAFMRAAARRFDGTYVPAGAASPLPAVRYYQVWNEPNLDGQLLPQNVRRGGRTVPVGADLYRDMLTRSYTAIKAVSSRNVVVAAGLAPYGDFPAGEGIRTPPVFFARQLLCLSRRSSGCGVRAPFDVFAVNVYPPTPGSHARNADDLALADMSRVRTLLSRAAARATIRAPHPVPLWVTEYSWATRAPDLSYVVSPATQARYYVDALYRLWSQGVSAAFWWRLRDGPGKVLGYQVASGFFSRSATVESDVPKPIAAAARLPFVIARAGTRFRVWVQPTTQGRLVVERQVAAGWVTVVSASARPDRPFARQVRAVAGQRWRARVGDVASLPRTAR